MLSQLLKSLFFDARKSYAEDIIASNKRDDSITLTLTQEDIYKSLYPKTRDRFKACMAAGMLSRPQIMYVKQLLNDSLGTKTKYYNQHYRNDAHEIYTKLKSPFLSNADFEKILDFLNNVGGEHFNRIFFSNH